MVTVPTNSWDETNPAGTRDVNLGDDDIREMKKQMREVIAVDHVMESSGNGATWGMHKWLQLIETADLGSGQEGITLLGNQTVDGKGELVYTDEDDNDVQITANGAINGGSLRLANNVYLKAIDAAGTGTIDLIKGDANDVAVVPDGTETATDAAPSSDKDLSNKKYVDDQITTNSKALGAYAAKSTNTEYEAETDGFVVLYADASQAPLISIQVDENSGLGVADEKQAQNVYYPDGANGHVACVAPVPLGWYWKAVQAGGTGHVWWVPMGS